MLSRAALAIATIWALGGHAAAQPMGPVVPEAPAPHFYVGGGVSYVHHTGYDPTHTFAVEDWVPGGKVFAGYQINSWSRLEVAYHYFGTSKFSPDFISQNELRSQAVALSAVFVAPDFSQWLMATPLPMRAIGKVGLAYKDVTQDMATTGRMNEGFLAFVVGAGLEVDITSRFFMRAEYEFISTAVGGPPQPVPSFKSTIDLTFGGTHRTINTMNTALTISGGIRF